MFGFQRDFSVPANRYVSIYELNRYGFNVVLKYLFILISVIGSLTFTIINTYAIAPYVPDGYKGVIDRNIVAIVGMVILPTLSFFILIMIHGPRILKTGYVFFFGLTMIMFGPFTVVVGFILTSSLQIDLSDASKNQTVRIIMMYYQLIIEIALIILGLYLSISTRDRLTANLKNAIKSIGKIQVKRKNFMSFSAFWNWFQSQLFIYWIAVVLVALGLAFLLQNLIFNRIASSTATNSMILNIFNDNQNDIELLLKGPLVGVIPTVIVVLVVAPIFEELSTREGIFSVFGDNWKSYWWMIAGICSVLFFCNMHLNFSNFIQIFNYMGTAIAFVLAYVFGRQSVLYSIPVHFAWNLIALLMIYG